MTRRPKRNAAWRPDCCGRPCHVGVDPIHGFQSVDTILRRSALLVELLFATGCLRNVEAVLQHLEARHDIARNRQDDRELRRGDLAGRLDPGLERSDDRGAALAGQDVLDFKGDGLGQRADIADEIGDRLAASLAADPGQHPIIALDLESDIGVERGGDLSRIPAAADPFQKLLCNSYVLLMTHLFASVIWAERFDARASRARWVEKGVNSRDPPRVHDGNVQSGDLARLVRRAECPGEPPTILRGVNAADLQTPGPGTVPGG